MHRVALLRLRNTVNSLSCILWLQIRGTVWLHFDAVISHQKWCATETLSTVILHLCLSLEHHEARKQFGSVSWLTLHSNIFQCTNKSRFKKKTKTKRWPTSICCWQRQFQKQLLHNFFKKTTYIYTKVIIKLQSPTLDGYKECFVQQMTWMVFWEAQ